ncbi:MAG: XRE family transcriptional regulator [Oceanococcus sp.]|nr:MAG: XRE family transcriptional regulator [Oceanococcus sp.]
MHTRDITERRIWELDQAINMRGVRLDLDYVRDALDIVDEQSHSLNRKVAELTGELTNVSQRAVVLDWCAAQGYPLDSYTKEAVNNAVADPACPKLVKEVLQVRQQLGKTSTAKYTKMLQCADPNDERVRGTLLYHGAATGRFAGRLIQPQNFPRPHPDIEGIEDTIVELVRARDWDMVRLIAGIDPMEALSSTLRQAIIASEGCRLIVSDYSAIEARVTPWLAGQEDTLDVFRAGGDIYKHAAAGIYGVDPADVDKQQRFIGKVATLALGYQGAVGAFSVMAAAYGVEMDEPLIRGIVDRWRKANPHIVNLWRLCEKAAKAAIKERGKKFVVRGKLGFVVRGNFLFMVLPSGRKLAYFRPAVQSVDGREKITFSGVNSTTRKWERQDTYGGKLVENAAQAVARDLMCGAMLRIEDAGYPLVLTVHDELIADVPEQFGSLGEFNDLMRETPDWATDLPIEVEGYEAFRYRK